MSRHILYVEDNPDQLSLVQTLLEGRIPGVVVDACCTAAGAEGFLNQRCYDVVICDVNLPGELGIDIAERILERDALQPIYLMTEYLGNKFQAAAAELGLELHGKFSQRDPTAFIDDIRKVLEQGHCDSSTAKYHVPSATMTTSADGGDCAAADQHGGTADTRASGSAVEIQRPVKRIRLTSPHVLAVRASLT
jgi:CheY-like chemotaxis protein